MATSLVSAITGRRVTPGGVTAPTAVGRVAMPHSTGAGRGALLWGGAGATGALRATALGGSTLTAFEREGHPSHKQNDRIVQQYFAETINARDVLYPGVPLFVVGKGAMAGDGSARSHLHVASLAGLNEYLRSDAQRDVFGTPADVLRHVRFLGVFLSDSTAGNTGEIRAGSIHHNPLHKHTMNVGLRGVLPVTPWWGDMISMGALAFFVVKKMPVGTARLAARDGGGGVAAAAAPIDNTAFQVTVGSRQPTAASALLFEALLRNPDAGVIVVGTCVDPAARRPRPAPTPVVNEGGCYRMPRGSSGMPRIGAVAGLEVAVFIALAPRTTCAHADYYEEPLAAAVPDP